MAHLAALLVHPSSLLPASTSGHQHPAAWCPPLHTPEALQAETSTSAAEGAASSSEWLRLCEAAALGALPSFAHWKQMGGTWQLSKLVRAAETGRRKTPACAGADGAMDA